MTLTWRHLAIIITVLATVLAASSRLHAGAHNSVQQPPSRYVITSDKLLIHAGTLLAVPGEPPLTNQSVVIWGDRILSVTAGFREPFFNETLIDLSDSFVLPGLMDAHVHIMAQPSAFVRNARSGGGPISNSDLAMNGSVYAQRTLAAGFTTIRDVGSNDESVFALRKAINQGMLAGPSILTAGPLISPTGGHGDRGFGASDSMETEVRRTEGVCDGADECAIAVRHNIGLGADLIKFTATGGFMSATGTQQQYEPEEMQAIVETAHMRDLKVAAHAYGADAAKLAIEAGVDSIEHGWMLDKSALRQMKKQGTYLVPTLLISRPSAWANMAGTAKGAAQRDEYRSFEQAYAMGVNIAFGTDVGIYDHGQNAREFAVMVAFGMSEADAIHSATVATADLFGLSDDRGVIQGGKRADIIAVKANPLEDIEALQDVSFVMKSGAVVKLNSEYLGSINTRPVIGSPVKF
ncbi:MAG: amidohydrolase family protein [Gammaproteobacteria bacterium]|jgi:imidazolonepropionase-like amidohydrolase|nr:amidohydrolase family protein [Gammaproteobacteria bacterium]MDP6694833.1 amidohydrolase family protein [Gammaproteobacteria bacterium]MDP7041275.1 amidohydrolase family protein [Gammaproteobacteria bacterium]